MDTHKTQEVRKAFQAGDAGSNPAGDTTTYNESVELASRPEALEGARGLDSSRPAPGGAALEDGSHHLRPPPDTFESSAGLREENERLREALRELALALYAAAEANALTLNVHANAWAVARLHDAELGARAALRLGGGR